MRRAGKVDDNQQQIVAALRDVGASVEILSGVGRGCPDIAAGYRGATYLLEIKDGAKVPSAQKLTPDEVAWHQRWKGHVAIVRNVDEALAVLGIQA